MHHHGGSYGRLQKTHPTTTETFFLSIHKGNTRGRALILADAALDTLLRKGHLCRVFIQSVHLRGANFNTEAAPITTAHLDFRIHGWS